MLRKQKVHFILLLVECMEQFGPTSSFNSERYTITFSYLLMFILVSVGVKHLILSSGAQNIFGNKMAPSRDIAVHFITIEHLRYITDGGYVEHGQR